MTRPHETTPGGQPLDLIGQPLHAGRGSVSGVFVVAEKGHPLMEKAPHDGKYLLGGHQFRMRAGQNLPPGAEPMADESAAPEPEAAEELL